MSDQKVKALEFNVEEVGKHLKGSKKRYFWTFELSGKRHRVVLDSSMLSGKVKLELDGKVIVDQEISMGTAFQHPFTLDGFSLNVLQQGDNFEFRINNKVFSHLYNQQKTKSSFKREQDCVEDIKVDTANFAAQNKIKINIGGAMKKKSLICNAESEQWSQMGGNQQFPNYFGQSNSNNLSQFQKNEVKKEQNASDLLDVGNTQEFNTMQNMFATQNPSKARVYQNTSIIDSCQDQAYVKPVQDFNTMQNMFNTRVPDNQVTYVDNNRVNVSQNKPSSIQEFSTMQNLFQTQANNQVINMNMNNLRGQQNQDLNTNEFNTMQNMFQTINLNNNSQSQSQQLNQQHKQNLQQQHTNLSTITENDFGTMQNMFATNNQFQVQSFNTNLNSKTQISALRGFQKEKDLNINLNDFNTMQNMFSTNNPTQIQNINTCQDSNIQISALRGISNQNDLNINLNDFNTMQNMFSTNNPNQLQGLGKNQNAGNLSVPGYVVVSSKIEQSHNQVNENNFGTLQNMFQTQGGVNKNLNNNIDLNIQNDQNQENCINLSDFSTMQQMFATNSANIMKANPQQVSNSNNQSNIILGDSTSNNVNAGDFSTMQHLFTTNNSTVKNQIQQNFNFGQQNFQ